MLRIMNPRPLQLDHDAGASNRDIGLVVKCWENARPLIKELEKTIHFAERKCGDLMQELNFCKEYYEKCSTERYGIPQVHQQKKKPKRRYNRKTNEDNRSSSENESDHSMNKQINESFSEKLRSKINEIANEIKEANRKIVRKDATFISGQKKNNENVADRDTPQTNNQEGITQTESYAAAQEERAQDPIKAPIKKKPPVIYKGHSSIQKYKLRSKSLPQGVRRKFGFGSFVEVVDRPKRNSCMKSKSKSRTSVSSGSKTVLDRSRPKTRTLTPRSRDRRRSKSVLDKTESSKSVNCSGDGDAYTVVSKIHEQSNKSFTNFSTDYGSNQMKLCTTIFQDDKEKDSKKSIIVARRQPIPFTICRTTKTFNLGLNIQEVLSMIKSKRHSTMLQSILKDNIQTARSVMRKTEPINALYIATSSRIGRSCESESCPARDDCYSLISANSTDGSVKCKLLTCRQSISDEVDKESSLPLVRQIKVNELQRPEDVWVVEQPDTAVQRYRSRCTCYQNKDSLDYQKVLKQYSKRCEKAYSPENFQTYSNGFVLPSPKLYSLPSSTTYDNNGIGPKLELKKIQEDLDHLTRRYNKVHEQLLEHRLSDFEVDAELDALEIELNIREDDCKAILNFYNQLLALKRKINALRGRIASSTNLGETNSKPPRSRKDPFRPTPSMTLTRVLRQIQCLQDRIKLIDSPSVT